MQRAAIYRPRPPHTTRPPAPVHTLVYSPAADRSRFIAIDLAREPSVVHVARGIREVVTALVDAPSPRPQVLVIDLDLLPPAELLHLHTVRDRGWNGAIIALGRVPATIRRSLGVTSVIALPLVEDTLRDAFAPIRYDLAAKD
jgi:hypothetical protein